MTTKELCFYVSVETTDKGVTRYLLRTNQSNWIYEFPWGDEILEENDPGYQAFYVFFQEKIRDVLFATKINDADFVTYKVFYNQEEKTTGKLTKEVGEDRGIFYRNSEIRDEIPVSYNRILFFRKLFRKMMS